MNLKDADVRDMLIDLVCSAEVFVEAYRSGVAERRLGIGPDDLQRRHPALIYGRMTGWGRPVRWLSRWPRHQLHRRRRGVGSDRASWRAARIAGHIIGDFAVGGMLLALGVIAALFEREKSGNGQVIDAALVDGAALLSSFMHGLHAVGMWNEPRGHNV